MIINGLDIIKNYNLILVSREIQPSEILTYNDWLENSLAPIKLKEEVFRYSTINITLLVEDASQEQVLLKISEIISKCKGGILQFTDLNYFYDFILEGYNQSKIMSTAYELVLQIKSTYKFQKEKVETFTGITNKEINVSGNLNTPAIVEIKPSIDMIDLIIEGVSKESITLKNLKKNKTRIINGKDCTVLEDKVNKFQDSDIWDFPVLKPGKNTIKLSKKDCTVNIKYEGRSI